MEFRTETGMDYRIKKGLVLHTLKLLDVQVCQRDGGKVARSQHCRGLFESLLVVLLYSARTVLTGMKIGGCDFLCVESNELLQRVCRQKNRR